MPLHLVIHLPQRTLKFVLELGDFVIGSDEGCDVVIPHLTVSRRHALLRLGEMETTIEDLGSSNGTLNEGHKVGAAEVVELGKPMSFGGVTGFLEEVSEGDPRPAFSLISPLSDSSTAEEPTLEEPSSEEPSYEEVRRQSVAEGPLPAEGRRPTEKEGGAGGATHTALSSSALENFTLGQLPRLLAGLRSGSSPVAFAQEVGGAAFAAFPCRELRVTHGHGSQQVVWFEAVDESSAPEGPTHEEQAIVRTAGELQVAVTFFSSSSAGRAFAIAYAPVVEAIVHLITLGLRNQPAHRERAAVDPPPLPTPKTREPRVREIYQRAALIGPGDIGVLICGESGTGKEVLARYLHAASGRPLDRLVTLNCAALPKDLLELELFGIEQAVATGVDARPGKFELAEGGTLFLDEIGDMALETQAKILRVLQEGEVYRLGAKKPRPARPRILAATNREIKTMMGAGDFRSDLFHRIAGWVVQLPPLRERRSDIPSLAGFFLNREAKRRGVAIAGISRSALDALVAWQWPGNVRELEREMARASLFLSPGELLESSHLDEAIRSCLDRGGLSLKDVLEQVERNEIERALLHTHDDTAAAAERLGIGRSTLYRRMKALGLQVVGG